MKLDTLTREEKLLWLEVVQEKKRRLREKAAVYSPNSGQLEVHRSLAITRCVFSGNGAGKTSLAANEAIWAAQGYNPITQKFSKVPARVIVLLDHPEKVGDVWVPELTKWHNIKEDRFHKRGKPYYTQIQFDNGSEILFMFHDQSPMIFESIELDYLICDEPPPRHVWVALRRGGRKKGRKPRFLIIGTPITGSWMRTEIMEPYAKGELEDTECFKFGTKVNEHNLADGYIAEFSKVLSEKERRIRLEGEFFDLEGLALAHLFKREVHTIEPFDFRDLPVVVAIDPHPKKAHFAVMLGVNEEEDLFFIKETNKKMVARDFAKFLHEWMADYNVVDIVCDSLGSSEGTGGEGFNSFLQVMNDEGIRARATTWDEKNDEDFIERIRGALLIPEEEDNFGARTPKLRIFRGNRGIISDIENVQWIKVRNVDEYKPKLDISNKDYLSCLKYALASNINYKKGKAKIYRRTRGMETYGVSREKYTTRRFRAAFRRSREAS